MRGNETPARIVTNFCTGVGVQDVITSANFYDCRLWGLSVVGGGQNLGFSIDLHRRPYNTLALPCECVIVTLKSALEVTQCHWNWCHSKAWVQFPIRIYSKCGRICSRLWDIQCQIMAWPWKGGWGSSRSLKMAPSDRPCDFLLVRRCKYSSILVTMTVSVAVCKIFSVKEWCDLENRVAFRSRSLEMAPFDRSRTSSYSLPE